MLYLVDYCLCTGMPRTLGNVMTLSGRGNDIMVSLNRMLKQHACRMCVLCLWMVRSWWLNGTTVAGGGTAVVSSDLIRPNDLYVVPWSI